MSGKDWLERVTLPVRQALVDATPRAGWLTSAVLTTVPDVVERRYGLARAVIETSEDVPRGKAYVLDAETGHRARVIVHPADAMALVMATAARMSRERADARPLAGLAAAGLMRSEGALR